MWKAANRKKKPRRQNLEFQGFPSSEARLECRFADPFFLFSFSLFLDALDKISGSNLHSVAVSVSHKASHDRACLHHTTVSTSAAAT